MSELAAPDWALVRSEPELLDAETSSPMAIP